VILQNFWFTGINMSGKRTALDAHERLDGIEPRIAKVEAELSTLQRSVQRVENILIGTAASVIGLLVTVLMRMG
jgi:tetrahydromethanopterin S-methyltransferase subunit G